MFGILMNKLSNNRIEIFSWAQMPEKFIGICLLPNGSKYWLTNGLFHREDGPAAILANGIKIWYLNNKCIWSSNWDKLDFTNKIILSKERHSMYPTVQVWKYIDENGIKEQIVILGMEEYISQ